MAVRFKTLLYTFVGTDPVSLYEILSSTANDRYSGSITVRAGATNAGDILWRDAAAGSAGGFLDAGEAAAFDLMNKYVDINNIFFNQSTAASDTLYITVMG